MKKTLALVLSVMMVLSLFAGMFSFTASAAEKGYAETEADKLWADANKATSITINVGGKLVDINAAVTNQKLADLYKDVELIAEENKATQSITLAGSFSFDGNGTLILKGASAMKTVKYPGTEYTDWTRDVLLINANGGLKVVLEDDFSGSIRGLDYAKADGTNVQVPAKSHLIVTGDANWNMIGNSIGWDNGSVVIYGDITLTSLLADVRKSETDGAANTGAYDCIIVRDNTKADGSAPHKQDGWDLILAPKYADLSGATGGAPVENRSGSTYITDDAYVVLGSNNNAFKITNSAKVGSKLVIRDNAVLVATGATNVLNLDYGTAKAGYVIQDNAFVSVTGTAVANWGAAMIGAGLDMTGGTLVVNGTAVASATASTALNIQKADGINLAGGKIHVTMKPAADSTTNSRMYAFFIKDIGAAGVNFSGADIYLNVDTLAGNDNNAALSTQITAGGTTYDINMTAGKLTVDAGANSHVYVPAVNPGKFNITGGDLVINGGKSAIYVAALNNEFNVGDAANVKITSPKGLWRDDAPIAVNGITLDNNAAAVVKGNAVAVSATAPAIPAKPSTDKPNPPTSDFVVAPFVAVAAMAVVASAAIVLRKKVNG